MGNWSEEKYDKVLVAKVVQLIAELENVHYAKVGKPRPAPSSRSYRQFVRELDPASTPVKNAFFQLFNVAMERRPNGVANTLAGPHSETTRRQAEGAAAEPSYIAAETWLDIDDSPPRSRFPEPERRRRITESHTSLPNVLGPQTPTSAPYSDSTDNTRPWRYFGETGEGSRRARAGAGARDAAADLPAPGGGAEEEWLEPMGDIMTNLEHLAERRDPDVNGGGDSWTNLWAEEDDAPAGASTMAASSRAWLAQYNVHGRNGQLEQQTRSSNSVPPSITELLTRYASAHEPSSSVTSTSRRAVPPRTWSGEDGMRPSPAQLLGRRQRGVEEDGDEEERPARRLRTYPLQREGVGSVTSIFDGHWRARERTDRGTRDTRRDGVVFDDEVVLAGVFGDYHAPSGEEGEDAGSHDVGSVHDGQE